jgi:hypothetical protein
VRARFVRVGRDYHFATGARAFRDHGHKIVTHTENAGVIRALVDIANERGWNDITVTGTARFRRDAWRAATVSGLVVRGYRPTEFDKQKLARDLAAAREPPRPTGPLVDFPQPPVSRTPVVMPAAPPSRARTTRRAAESAEYTSGVQGDSKRSGPDQRDRIYFGTLLGHGPAPYEFHPHGEPSYFLRMQTQRGAAVLWGKDLERALQEAKVAPGQEIHVRQAGRESVTVRRRERDPQGRVVKEHNMKAHRNQWEVSRNEEASLGSDERDVARTTLSSQVVSHSTRETSSVDSASRALKAAQLFANDRIKEPAQRSAFVSAVREELARAFEHGDGGSGVRREGRERDSAPSPARTLS